MNALLMQEFKKKRQRESSSSVTHPIGDSSVRTRPRANSTHVTQVEENPEVQPRGETSSRLCKRKVVVETGTLQGEHTPIAQVEEHANGGEDAEEYSRPRPRIYDGYASQVALLGKGPSHMASRIACDLTSEVDADYLDTLDTTEIMQRTCSSAFEVFIYAGVLVRRQQAMIIKARKEKREVRATFARLEQQLSQAKDEHARELAKLRREKDVEFQAGQKALQEMEKKLIAAHQKLEDTQAQAAREKESFKEEYLKSAEFQAACFKKAFSYLEIGFQGAVDQFAAKGYPPEGASTNFISFADFVTNLPPDE